MHRLRPLLLIPLFASVPASAHGGEREGATGWSTEPVALALLALSMLLYGVGLFRMTTAQRQAIAPSWRVTSYCAAVITMVVALFSPLDALADEGFAWHMLQHLLLILAAAPLLSLANTHLVSLFALPMAPRRHIGRTVSGTPGVRRAATSRLSPLTAAALFAAGLWLWHAPKMYDAALANSTLHTVEHLTFILTSAVFWRMVLRAGDRRLDPGTSIFLTVIVGLQANLLAALLLLSPRVIYPSYKSAGLVDQQIAALLMFVPASFVFLGASIWSIAKLVRGSSKHGAEGA